MNPPEKLAFFDLDRTIVPHDTQALFAQFVITKQPWRRVYLLWFLPCLIPALLGLFDLRAMKRIFFSFLWGATSKQVKSWADQFAGEVVPNVAYREVISEVERLRSEGYTTVLNSASPILYVEGIARHFQFDHYIGTELTILDRMPFLPAIRGPNNKHAAKVEAMQKRGILPHNWDHSKPLPKSWAYSDSSTDLPLLELAEHAVTVHPGRKLREIAHVRSWEILTPPRPYSGKWGDRLAEISLALGLGGRFLSRPASANHPEDL